MQINTSIVEQSAERLAEREYLQNTGQLVSERSCRKLRLEELKRELELLGGPPTDFAEAKPPMGRAH